MHIHQILKQYWDHDNFRPLQEDIINAVLEGNDVLALLPTGGGKSVCFQVPALAKDGICLVISPLIALMRDQVENLKQKGIPALAIYSGMSFVEIKKTLQNAAHGNYKFLYVSPERLETRLFRESLASINVNLMAVDEAHCISQWGYDFRPPYVRIAALREYLPKVPVLALTASATSIVQDDICDKLAFGAGHKRFQQSFERPNLSYSAFNVPSKQNKILEILNNVPGTAIVYCKSRKHTKEIADLLRLNKISADFYHAGLSNDERTARQENWIKNKTRVMACTNAFGMGIDKPGVRVVVHYDVPDCLENYYQEAGRAGRDNNRAYAVLLYSDKELDNLREQSDIRFPADAEIKKVYIALMNHLQVAAGSGEGTSYDLDIAIFANAFKLNILHATYAIKALEQEDIISFNEVFFKPSTVVFTTNREELNEIENQHPEFEPVIKGLLRSYEGIFDFPATVYESRLAKFIQADVQDVKRDLKKLNDLGIISYEAQKDSPQLTLLQNRMYNDNYLVNTANHLNRKKIFEERIEAMINYVNARNCRSEHIAAYFSDVKIKACGICDNCIRAKQSSFAAGEFDHLSNQILDHLRPHPASVDQILASLKAISKDKIWTAINFLQAEGILHVNEDGNLYITNARAGI